MDLFSYGVFGKVFLFSHRRRQVFLLEFAGGMYLGLVALKCREVNEIMSMFGSLLVYIYVDTIDFVLWLEWWVESLTRIADSCPRH